ncbi:FxLYD domain-containing protein [Halolamina sp. C58]|uniref:FxLYD domain-containing protein n=1 Tax=Halolamina sp. C58 TaxID=3421640 RepID=UPI003EB8C6E5
MRRRALLARTALLTTAAGLAGCSSVGDGSDSPTDSPTASPTPTPSTIQTPESGSLAVVEHTLSRSNEGSENELVAVEATIENGRSEPADVTATARFFDDEGAVLDESEASTTDLPTGGRWSVELLYPGSGEETRAVADYRLVIERAD